MSNHGLRRLFSLLLAVMMVCTLLPAAVFAEEGTEPPITEEQPVIHSGGEQKTEDAPADGEKEADSSDGIQPRSAAANQAEPAADTNAPIVQSEAAPAVPNFDEINVSVFVSAACGSIPAHKLYSQITQSDIESGYCSVTKPRETRSGVYVSTLTIHRQKWLEKMNLSFAGHTLITYADPTVTLTYKTSDHKWTANTRYAYLTVTCISDADVKTLLGQITVACDDHGSNTYAPISGSFSRAGAQKDAATGDYTCDVTVKPDEYVEKYNEKVADGHTLSSNEGNKIIKLRYTAASGKWSVESGTPVVFAVACETVPAVPEKPSDAKIAESTASVNCSVHGSLTWNLKSGTTVGEVEGDADNGYTCTVTVDAATYVGYFNQNKKANGVTHTLTSSAKPTFTLRYVDGVWERPTNPAVKIDVNCQPETTYTVTYTDGVEDEEVFADQVTDNLLSGAETPAFNGTPMRAGYTFDGWNPAVSETVTGDVTYTAKWTKQAPSQPSDTFLQKLPIGVTCSNDNRSHQYSSNEFNMIPGSYDTGNVEQDEYGSYFCTITVHAKLYAEKFSNEEGIEHVLADGEKDTKEFKVWYDDDYGWDLPFGGTAVFDVTCEKAQSSKPSKLTRDEVAALQLTVRVICANNSACHGGWDYQLTSDAIAGVGDVAEVNGVYSCVVSVESGIYVSQFNTSKGLDHFPAIETKTFTLTYQNGKWTKVGGPAVTFDVECRAAPGKPSDAFLQTLSIGVTCSNGNRSHQNRTKKLSMIPGSYDIGEVEQDENGSYFCTVTVRAKSYVDQFSADEKAEHILADGEVGTKRFAVCYDDDAGWSLFGATAAFAVTCKEAGLTKPDKPTREQVEALLGNAVEVGCISTDPRLQHDSEVFPLAAGGYDLGEAVEGNAEDGYTYTVTVKPDAYVEAYNEWAKEHYPQAGWQDEDEYLHYLFPKNQGDKTITLRYSKEDGWYVDSSTVPVTYTTLCGIDLDEFPDQEILDLDLTVAVECTAGHGSLTWKLRAGTFTSDYVSGDEDTGYTCTVTVKSDEYVKLFNSSKQAHGVKHSLADDAEKTFTLTSADSNVWTVPDGKPTVTFKVGDTFTVTYTDGVGNEEAFVDQVYGDLKSGAATPQFRGTPTRKNYVFAGWTPAVSETVTADATYAAQWKEDRNNNGKPDDEEERCTVTYTDGASGKVFQDKVYSDLLPDTDTPAFNGTPKRTGYVFAGWTPEVAKTVTGDATYTAQWEEDRNGNGIADRDEEKFTVTYTDGASGKVFQDEVYPDLLSGTDTPAFTGTPKRTGYTFAGWTPKVDKTVTKNVTYTAAWKVTSSTGKDNTGKDKVPKTGDSGIVPILGGVLLVSFCGAAAVCVFDRKRKQGR